MAGFEEILSTINSNTDREINLFNAELEAVLKTVEELTVIRAVELISDPLQFDYAMTQILNESGYYALVNDFIDKSYDKNYTEIIDLFKSGGLTATFSKADIANITNIKQLDLDFFNDIGNQASQKLKADLYKYSLSDLTKKDMVSNIKASLSDTDLVRYSSTYAETAISNFNNNIIALKTVDIKEAVFIYVGVSDKKTRSFCRCVLRQKKYYNRSDASKIRYNKARTYNCRHIITGVSKEYAISSGYKKGTPSC